MSVTGRIVSEVDVRHPGDTLADPAAASALTLTVYESVHFSESGGRLVVGDSTTPVTYVTVNTDTNVVTLAAPGLPAAAEQGDPVWLWDDDTGAPMVEYVADVALDGEESAAPLTIPTERVPFASVGAPVEVDEDDDGLPFISRVGVEREPRFEGSALVTPLTRFTVTGPITIPNTTQTPIVWGAAPIPTFGRRRPGGVDTGGGWIDLPAGVILISVMVAWSSASSLGSRQIRLTGQLNGVDSSMYPAIVSAPANTGAATSALVTTQYVVAGQRFRVEVFQSSTGSLDVVSGLMTTMWLGG